MKKRALFLTAVSLVGAFNAACTPPQHNSGMSAEHAAAVSVMLNSSIARCSPHDAPPAYYARLERALQPVATETLTTLHRHNVVICLDARLEQQSVQEGHNKIGVVYYGADRVAAVTDNGQHDQNAPVHGWQSNPAFMVARGPLARLAERLEAGEINAAQNYYSNSWSKSGKSGGGGSTIESEAEASLTVKTHIARNAWIRNAPEASPGNEMALSVRAPTTHISANASAKFTL